MSFLEKVRNCNRRDLARLVPFVIDGVQLGWLTPERADVLLGIPAVFGPCEPGNIRAGVTFSTAVPAGADVVAWRSRAVADIASVLTATGLFAKPRREIYAVRNRWADAPALRLDRAFVPAFGARAYGVHVNGYMKKRDGVHLWIGTRAHDLRVEPGKRDNMVAGGQPADLGLMENLIKECAEEAGLGADVARRAVPAGIVSYAFEAREGLKNDTLFCYDLAVPEDVTPQVSDEIIAYELMPVREVLALVRDTDTFKFNVNLVILDFAIRWGLLDPERERDFETISWGLREIPQLLV
jgi:8-oxo-dGTP pyrophosphatase MutT (NUDIX family)